MQSDEESFGWTSVDEDEDRISSIPEINTESKMKEKTVKVKIEKSSNDYVENSGLHSAVAVMQNGNSEITRKFEKTSPVSSKSVSEQKKTAYYSNGRSSFNASSTTNRVDNNEPLLEGFIENNKNLMKVITPCRFEITDEDDLYMLQCPKNIDIERLVGLNILQKDKKKFKIDSSSYECISSLGNDINKVTLLLPPNDRESEYKINSFDVSGTFVIREKLKSNNDVEVIEEQQSVVPFPSGLKVRHPLLGAHYKPLLKIPPSVKDKFKASVVIPKQKNITAEVDDDDATEIKSKRKRHKDNLDESFPPSKKIKKEKNPWMSEISIEKSLFDVPINITKIKKNKS